MGEQSTFDPRLFGLEPDRLKSKSQERKSGSYVNLYESTDKNGVTRGHCHLCVDKETYDKITEKFGERVSIAFDLDDRIVIMPSSPEYRSYLIGKLTGKGTARITIERETQRLKARHGDWGTYPYEVCLNAPMMVALQPK